jgi:unsaturated rhamnogalacturonyl hydrolase
MSRFLKNICTVISAGGILVAANAQTGNVQAEALSAAKRVADKLVRDTRFALTLSPQKEELGMQVIDLREMLKTNDQTVYALRRCSAKADTVVRFGINHSGSIVVYVNGNPVYRNSSPRLQMPAENAYNRFDFEQYFTARFRKGENEIRIRYTSSAAPAVVFLRAQLPIGDADNALRFETTPQQQWMLMGPFTKNDTTIVGTGAIQTYYQLRGKYFTWQNTPQRLLPELLIDTTLTYQRDPYLDWNYSNGNTVWSVLSLTGITGDTKYKAFVQRYTQFMMDQLPYFRRQYDSLFDFRGSFHRFFRMSMLDDAGSAVLPFVDLYLTDKDQRTKQQVIDPVADYILHKQVRLPDGIFCRPEPVAYTVWCDDLFMSVPFLLRWARITGNTGYYDEAIKQFRGFRKYLRDPVSKLYRHGWFSNTQQQSPVHWGRANGWIVWAAAELLEHLPASHPGYQEVLSSFREQVAVLAGLQEKNGMWHQVLDRPASFEETSCTAMFTMVMAKGVRKGWLDRSYRDNAIRGWQAVQRKIEADGTVHDICRGTEIGFDEAFYFERKRFDQDPRGLGAVIAAGVEVSRIAERNMIN